MLIDDYSDIQEFIKDLRGHGKSSLHKMAFFFFYFIQNREVNPSVHLQQCCSLFVTFVATDTKNNTV
jgi:hypothetical protein